MSQQINLFNPVFLKQKRIFAAGAMARALGVLLLGLSLLAGYGQWSLQQLRRQSSQQNLMVELRKAQLAKANADLVPRKKNAALEAEAAEVEAQLAALKKATGAIAQGDLGNTNGYAEYFVALARQRVDGLWLTGVTVVGAGGDLTVQGGALDASLVPAFIQRLGSEAAFKGKQFGSLEISEPQPLAGAQAAASAGAAPEYVEFSLRATPVQRSEP
ncbi:MAG: PilN domain-containing protein [Telluria sp.]